MKASERKRWPYLLKQATGNGDQRRVALIRAYSWVEHALGAIGLKRGKAPISKILHQAHEMGYLPRSRAWDQIRQAVETRHAAAHMDTVPDDQQCRVAVETLQAVWCHLRDQVVSKTDAAKFAARILKQPGVDKIALSLPLKP